MPAPARSTTTTTRTRLQAVYWLTWENDATASPLPGVAAARREVAALGVRRARPSTRRACACTWSSRSSMSPGVVGRQLELGHVHLQFAHGAVQRCARRWPIRRPLRRRRARVMYDGSGNGFVFTARRAGSTRTRASKATTTFSYFAQNDSLRVRIVGQSDALVAGGNTITIENSSVQVGTTRAAGPRQLRHRCTGRG